MKSKQDVQLALLLLLGPAGFSKGLIAALETWLLLLLSPYFSKDGSMLELEAELQVPLVRYL